jgi:hypothetical protein
MENFAPLAGSIVVLAYDDLGQVGGISLEVREILDDKGGRARGALVVVKQDKYHTQNAFIDADEIPELLKGFDAILSVRQNPSSFKFFEIQYTTRGAFQLLAFNNQNGVIVYGVKAGRGAVAQIFNLQTLHLQRLKSMFEAANAKLNSLPQE